MASGEKQFAEDDEMDPLKGKFDASNLVAGDSTKETSTGMQWKFHNLGVDIRPRPAADTDEDSGTSNLPITPRYSPKRVNFPNAAVSPPSAYEDNNSNIRRHYASSRPDVENTPIFPFEDSYGKISQRPQISRSMSLTKLFNPKLKRTSDSFTLPAEGYMIEPHLSTKESTKRSIHRSYSVPVIRRDGRVSLHGNNFRFIPTFPQKGKEVVATQSKSPTYDSDKKVECGKHISEEESVCRICLIELANGTETIKTECSCRGELALAHQECAIKWFSTKGNRTCDVCKQEVRNLPITLPRPPNVQAYNSQGNGIEPAGVIQYRVWQDIPILVIISMLAYFGFLEQLLAGRMGSGAVAISLPFACILGLLASIAAATMVWKKYVWIYATVQFALLIAFSQIFYLALHMEPFLAILLATFSGFGVTMVSSSILVKILRRTRRWLDRSNQTHSAMQSDGSFPITRAQVDPRPDLQRRSDELMQSHLSPTSRHQSQMDPLNHQDVEMGVSQALQQG